MIPGPTDTTGLAADTTGLPADPHARVRLAMDLIGSAGNLLTMFPFAEAAAGLRRQMDAAWYTDPTAMLRGRANLESQLRLLDAAAAYAAAFRAEQRAAIERGAPQP